MNVSINHCWCTDSNWGGLYACRVTVSLYRVPEGKTYYDPPCPDWALVEEHPYQSTAKTFNRETLRLRADVAEWLAANVKDRKAPSDVEGGPKGWAVGSDEYNSTSGIHFTFFFHRRSDAMAFIKRWSVHKRPVNYLNYFTDRRFKLNPATGRMQSARR